MVTPTATVQRDGTWQEIAIRAVVPGDLIRLAAGEHLGANGFRVLAVASRRIAARDKYTTSDESELVLAGFVSFADPVLPDAAATLAELRRWDMHVIRDFMLFIGPISSVFDFLTFYVMLHVFHAG
jgi:magnesium-transporting ATPase (P-type)